MTREQVEKLKASAKPGDALFIGNNDFIANVIQFSQALEDPTWRAKFTHCGFITDDGQIAESTISLKLFPTPDQKREGARAKIKFLAYVSGVVIQPIEKWVDGHATRNIVLQRYEKMNAGRLHMITKMAWELKNRKMFYPVMELIGTLICAVEYAVVGLFRTFNPKAVDRLRDRILAQRNPLDEKNGMYCCAFLAHCFKIGGIQTLPKGSDETSSTLPDILTTRGKVGGGRFKLIDLTGNMKD